MSKFYRLFDVLFLFVQPEIKYELEVIKVGNFYTIFFLDLFILFPFLLHGNVWKHFGCPLGG
jgi:hypothetical protein